MASEQNSAFPIGSRTGISIFGLISAHAAQGILANTNLVFVKDLDNPSAVKQQAAVDLVAERANQIAIAICKKLYPGHP